jgi:hypothetical protein
MTQGMLVGVKTRGQAVLQKVKVPNQWIGNSHLSCEISAFIYDVKTTE